MATKAQKRQSQRYKEEIKDAAERMQHLDEKSIANIENYAVYQILYMNDVACNECKFLGEELKTIPYKSKAVHTVYNALMKRVNAYWDFINNTKVDQYSIANLFEGMDGYLDDKIADFKNAVTVCLKNAGIQYAHWVASVECASTLCDYATMTAKDYIRSVSKISPNAKYLLGLCIEEIFNVARSLSETVQDIHVGKTVINLNDNPKIVSSFNKLNKAFTNPKNFINAVSTADKANEKENRIQLMY